MAVTVRLAASADVARLQAIEVDAGERFRVIGLDSIADDQPPPSAVLEGHVGSGTAWVACSADGLAIGYALASVVDREAHLDQISVIRSAVGHGVGRSLIEAVLAWARSRDLDSITLTTFRHVPWNGPYYESLGFIVLPPPDWGVELSRIRDEETRSGLDIEERVAMRRSTLALTS